MSLICNKAIQTSRIKLWMFFYRIYYNIKIIHSEFCLVQTMIASQISDAGVLLITVMVLEN